MIIMLNKDIKESINLVIFISISLIINYLELLPMTNATAKSWNRYYNRSIGTFVCTSTYVTRGTTLTVREPARLIVWCHSYNFTMTSGLKSDAARCLVRFRVFCGFIQETWYHWYWYGTVYTDRSTSSPNYRSSCFTWFSKFISSTYHFLSKISQTCIFQLFFCCVKKKSGFA